MTGILNALIAGVSGAVKDTYFNLVSLLLPGNGTNGAQNNTFLDSSSNNFTITRNGNTTQGTFSPFSQTGWGNYFDGTGDWLSIPANSAFDFGTGDFTVECWFYYNTTPPALYDYLWAIGGNNTNGIALFINNGQPRIWNGSLILSTTGSISGFTWYHLAAVRSSGTLTVYLNGTSIGSVSLTSNLTGGASAGPKIAKWDGVDPEEFTGYISNFRIVKGVAVYTGAFTPPTSPLASTQSAGTNISAITGTQTSLLTCQSNRFIDNSSNNFTITVNGNTSVVAFSPFNPTASWSAATYGGSGYFDGSGDYLSVADNANLRLGTSAFTIQAWVYRNASGTAHSIIAKGGASTGYVLQVTSTNVLRFTHGTTNVDTTTTIPASAWTHVAAVRTNTSTNGFQLYINGVSSATATVSTDFNQTDSLYIGGDRSAANVMNGYISGLKYTNGTAESISVPTAPPTATTNVALLTNFTNAGITDATAKNDLETVGNAQISTTQSKWGGGSMYFDGTGDWLQLPASDIYAFGSGDYTVEAWVYFTSINNTTLQIIFMSGSTGGNSFYFHVDGNQISVGTSAAFISNQVATFTTGLWYHIAACRSGTTLRLFVNGTQAGSNATDTTNWTSSGNARIGANETGGQTVFGYIDDLRITKGYARYTANFTVPAAPFPVQ